MITEKRKFGNAGEDMAVEYLLAKGYVLLGRNVQESHHEERVQHQGRKG